MKKTRTNSNKGITLIALVITIIVLLILAAVSIATLTGENGILTKANDAKTNNTIGEEKEQIGLAYNAVMADNKGSGVTAEQLQDELKKYDSEITVADEEGSFTVKFPNGHVYTVKKDGTIDDSAVGGTTPPTEGTTILKPGDTATKTETDNYEDTNEEKATIPKDFKVSEEDNTIDTGLVVTAPDGSEFVWVPVPNAVSENINDKPIAREIEDLKGQNDTNGNKYYQGILYSFSSSESTEMTDYGQGTTSWREPSLVTHDDRDKKHYME